jgi:hypothetical protein
VSAGERAGARTEGGGTGAVMRARHIFSTRIVSFRWTGVAPAH